MCGRLFLSGLLMSAFSASAQDMHHSQFWMNPLSYNPASAGFFNGDFRAGTSYRNQWLSVTVPYQTFGIWADAPVVKRMVQQDIIGVGICSDFDRAGDARYSTLQTGLFLSYSKALNRRNSHFLSVGMVLGYAQKRFSPSGLMHDDQYGDGKYDPWLPTREVYPGNSFSYADIGSGVQWFYQNHTGVVFQAGISALHMNRPTQSIFRNDDILLPVKFTGQFNMRLPMGDEEQFLQPALYFSRQNAYTEIMAGILGSYQLQYGRLGSPTRIVGGFDYRLGDALYFVAGGEWRNFQLLVSYDVNVSSLMRASHGRGGVELNLQYMYRKPRVIRRHNLPCPIW